MKKSILRTSINTTFWNGITDIILKSLMTGPLLTAYVVGFGFGNVTLGFLQSLYSLSSLLHIPVSFLLEKGKTPKKIALFFSITGNSFLLLIMGSFIWHNSTISPLIFVVAYTLFLSMIGVIGGAFWPWCKKIVPHNLLTSFFAHRIRYILFVKIISVSLATLFISYLSKNHSENNQSIYAIIIFFAFMTGGVYTYTLFQMPNVKLDYQADISFFKKLRFVLMNKSFISFALNIGLANFSLVFFTSFVMIFLLKGLNLSIAYSMFFSIGGSCIDIGVIGLWKKYAHKNGNAKMLCCSFLTFIPCLIILIYQSIIPYCSYYLIALAFALIGLGNSGTNLGISDSSISCVPEKYSSIYISSLNIGRFFFSGLGSLFAGITLSLLEKFTTDSYAFFFMICTVLFICSAFRIRYLKHIELQ